MFCPLARRRKRQLQNVGESGRDVLDINKTQKPAKRVGLLGTLLGGGERDRLTSRGQLLESERLYCWPIITGEDFITSSHSSGLDSATVTRAVRVAMDGMNHRLAKLLTEIQADSWHLCAVGRAWIEWLADDG